MSLDVQDGTALIGRDDGTGPAVVFVHGVGSDSHAWTRMTESLRDDYRVLCVDLPGISLRRTSTRPSDIRIMAAELDATLGERGVDSYSLVGHSFGGVVALVCAQDYPARVSALSLIAPGGFGPELSPALHLMSTRAGNAALWAVHRPRFRARIERAAERYKLNQPDGESIDELLDTYHRLGSPQARRYFRDSVTYVLDMRRALSIDAIDPPQAPVQILWGAQDRVLPPWQCDRASRRLAARDVHVIAGAGHSPHRSHAPEVGRYVARFLGDAGRP